MSLHLLWLIKHRKAKENRQLQAVHRREVLSNGEYVAGDSVEFDFTDEKQQPAEEQSQMELF